MTFSKEIFKNFQWVTPPLCCHFNMQTYPGEPCFSQFNWEESAQESTGWIYSPYHNGLFQVRIPLKCIV